MFVIMALSLVGTTAKADPQAPSDTPSDVQREKFNEWFQKERNLANFYREQPSLKLKSWTFPSLDRIVLEAEPKDPKTWDPSKTPAAEESLRNLIKAFLDQEAEQYGIDPERVKTKEGRVVGVKPTPPGPTPPGPTPTPTSQLTDVQPSAQEIMVPPVIGVSAVMVPVAPIAVPQCQPQVPFHTAKATRGRCLWGRLSHRF